jgi:hypothetical protein
MQRSVSEGRVDEPRIRYSVDQFTGTNANLEISFGPSSLIRPLAEVACHQERLLADTRVKEDAPVQYVDIESDFNCDFHRLDALEQKACLQPEPVPQCYSPGQSLAHTLMFNEKSNGIVYNSVRSQDGTCIVCFRPVLVYPIRRGARLQLEVQPGGPQRWSESSARSISRYSLARECVMSTPYLSDFVGYTVLQMDNLRPFSSRYSFRGAVCLPGPAPRPPRFSQFLHHFAKGAFDVSRSKNS